MFRTHGLFNFHDIDEEAKEQALLYHSERSEVSDCLWYYKHPTKEVPHNHQESPCVCGDSQLYQDHVQNPWVGTKQLIVRDNKRL